MLRALVKDTNVSFLCEDSPEEGTVYSLIQQDLTQIKPNYEAMIKQGQLKVTDMGVQHGKQGLKHGKCCFYFFILFLPSPSWMYMKEYQNKVRIT